MHPTYVLLFTLLLYIFFGTIVDVFIATKKSTQFFRIRAKVFFYTYIAPIMFALVMFFVILTDNKAFNIFFGCVLLISSLIRMISTDKKYLTEFQIDGNLLKINYLTLFLKSKSSQFNLVDISNMELVKANWLIDYPAAVNVRHKEDWVTFEIIDKKLKADVQNDVDAFLHGTI
jgi:hypothetical protein